MLSVHESNEGEVAYMAFGPRPIGEVEVFEGKWRKVVDNTSTYIVTYQDMTDKEIAQAKVLEEDN